jgi:hypothetical protein
VKGVFPQGLLINGQNPLTLLHSALSEGLHADTDEECLQYAHDVRVVLTELAERMGQAMKDEAEIAAAITRLTKKRSTNLIRSDENFSTAKKLTMRPPIRNSASRYREGRSKPKRPRQKPGPFRTPPKGDAI